MIPIPRIQGSVNAPEFNRALTAFYQASKLSWVDAFRFQGRKLFERIINWSGGAIATPPRTKKQGDLAVKRDIYRTVFPLRAEGFNDVKLRKRVRTAIDAGDHVSLQKLVAAGVFGSGLRKAFVARFDPEMHTGQRGSRGRVTRNSKGTNYQYATDEVAELKAYVKRRQQMVGQGKGGWAAALRQLGGRPAAWVARHVRAGSFVDRLLPGNSKISFTGINQSAWASGGDEDRIVEMAMEGRAQAIMADVERKLEGDWRKSG